MRNARVFFNANFTPAYMKGSGRTYERMILSEPKFLGCIDNRIFLPFLPMVLRITPFLSIINRWGCVLLSFQPVTLKVAWYMKTPRDPMDRLRFYNISKIGNDAVL